MLAGNETHSGGAMFRNKQRLVQVKKNSNDAFGRELRRRHALGVGGLGDRAVVAVPGAVGGAQLHWMPRPLRQSALLPIRYHSNIVAAGFRPELFIMF